VRAIIGKNGQDFHKAQGLYPREIGKNYIGNGRLRDTVAMLPMCKGIVQDVPAKQEIASTEEHLLAMTDGLIGRNATVSKFFLETPVVLQVYALGGNPAAEDGGFSRRE
jgi:hypothetical protein